jgi:hypothetical protein
MPLQVYTNTGQYVYLLSVDSTSAIQAINSAYALTGAPGLTTFVSIPGCVAGQPSGPPAPPPEPVPPAQLTSWTDVANFLTVIPTGLIPWVIFTTNAVPDECDIAGVFLQAQQLLTVPAATYLQTNTANGIYVGNILTRASSTQAVQGIQITVANGTYTQSGDNFPFQAADLANDLQQIASTPGYAYMYLIYSSAANVYNNGLGYNVSFTPLACQVNSTTGSPTQTANNTTAGTAASTTSNVGGQTGGATISQGTTTTSSKWKTILIIIAVIVVVIIIGAILFFVFRRSKSKTVTPATGTTSTVTPTVTR